MFHIYSMRSPGWTKVDLAERRYTRNCTKDEAFDLVELTLETLKEGIAKERSLQPPLFHPKYFWRFSKRDDILPIVRMYSHFRC
jgi:hypothetical protein